VRIFPRWLESSDLFYTPEMLHTVVVYPESTEEVSELVKIANKYRMPVVPYSGGTSLEGQFRGVRLFPAYIHPTDPL